MLLFLLACVTTDPGEITVVAEGIVGATGLLLVTEALDVDGNQAAIACLSIDADPYDATFTMEEIVGSTPGEDSAPIELDGGEYTISSGVIAGGETTPSQCAEATVTVDGDVTVTLPAFEACG